MLNSRRRSASIFCRVCRGGGSSGRPVCRPAAWRWTCAIDADARAVVSRSRKTSSGGRPRCAPPRAAVSSNGTGATSLCSFSNSAIQSGGKRSTRVAMTWPSLTKVGPSSSQREPHALRGLEPLDVAAAAHEHLAGALEDVGDAEPTDEVAEPVPDQDAADLLQARELPHTPPVARSISRPSVVFRLQPSARAARRRPRKTRRSRAQRSVR